MFSRIVPTCLHMILNFEVGGKLSTYSLGSFAVICWRFLLHFQIAVGDQQQTVAEVSDFWSCNTTVLILWLFCVYFVQEVTGDV